MIRRLIIRRLVKILHFSGHQGSFFLEISTRMSNTNPLKKFWIRFYRILVFKNLQYPHALQSLDQLKITLLNLQIDLIGK